MSVPASNNSSSVEVDGDVLDAKRVLEALGLGRAPREWSLAAFEARLDGAAGALALGAAAGGLAALARDPRAARLRFLFAPAAGLRS